MAFAVVLPACAGPSTKDATTTAPGATDAKVYSLTNTNCVEIRTIPYGAIITSIKVPDRYQSQTVFVFGVNK